jgi:hypothetical protein
MLAQRQSISSLSHSSLRLRPRARVAAPSPPEVRAVMARHRAELRVCADERGRAAALAGAWGGTVELAGRSEGRMRKRWYGSPPICFLSHLRHSPVSLVAHLQATRAALAMLPGVVLAVPARLCGRGPCQVTRRRARRPNPCHVAAPSPGLHARGRLRTRLPGPHAPSPLPLHLPPPVPAREPARGQGRAAALARPSLLYGRHELPPH